MARVSFILAFLLAPQLSAGFATNNNNNNSLRSSALCNSSDDNNCNEVVQRRALLNTLFRSTAALTMATTLSTSTPALALDMDAFESSLIKKDSESFIPKLNDDEALCKYGSPGKAMGEACERAKMKPNLPGIVDATGKVDRGDYLKCVYQYPVINGQYVKTRVCKPSYEWDAD